MRNSGSFPIVSPTLWNCMNGSSCICGFSYYIYSRHPFSVYISNRNILQKIEQFSCVYFDLVYTFMTIHLLHEMFFIFYNVRSMPTTQCTIVQLLHSIGPCLTRIFCSNQYWFWSKYWITNDNRTNLNWKFLSEIYVLGQMYQIVSHIEATVYAILKKYPFHCIWYIMNIYHYQWEMWKNKYIPCQQ